MVASCPVCSGSSTQPCLVKRIDDNEYAFVQCPSCGLVFVSPAPTEEELRRHYEHLWSQGQRAERAAEEAVDQQLRHERFRQRLRELNQLSEPGRLLDVGCRDGVFLEVAREAGWRPSGVELVASAAEQARQRGCDVRAGTLEEANWPPGSFDAVTVWHLIEHLPSPLPLLQAIRRLLKPAGILAIETPNIESRAYRRDPLNWEYLAPPQHLCYFGPRSLAAALQRAGYEVVFQRSEGGTGLGRHLARAGLGGLRLWLRRHYGVLQPMRRLYLACWGWRAPVDDILIMFARPRISSR